MSDLTGEHRDISQRSTFSSGCWLCCSFSKPRCSTRRVSVFKLDKETLAGKLMWGCSSKSVALVLWNRLLFGCQSVWLSACDRMVTLLLHSNTVWSETIWTGCWFFPSKKSTWHDLQSSCVCSGIHNFSWTLNIEHIEHIYITQLDLLQHNCNGEKD